LGQSCGPDAGCCSGAYCWGFTGSCVADDVCQGAPAAANLCSCDGFLAGPCPSGQLCPPPAHGHDTYCCGATAASCQADGDCCSGSCDGGGCAQGGSFAVCGGNADCLSGTCTAGQCVPVDIGAGCQQSAACNFGLFCDGGLCTCLTAGTITNDSANCCGSWSNVGGSSGVCQCAQTTPGGPCVTAADCCYSGSKCVSYVCS
jgi:hypothetical protein